MDPNGTPYLSWMERYYDERTIWTQNIVSDIWANFVKNGGNSAEEFKNGHCFIGMEYLDWNKEAYLDCDFRKEYIYLWDSIVGENRKN